MAKAGSVEIPVELNTKGFEQQIEQTERELQDLVKEYEEAKKQKAFVGQEEELKDQAIQIEKVKNKLIDLKAKQDNLSYGKGTAELSQHEFQIGKIIKKVGKWALAVFGLRSIYSFIRSSISTIAQYDTQLATNIEYIRYALAYSIKPIIEWIVQAVFTILQYVNYIAQAWFGKNLFANSGIKQFQSGMAKAEKSAKNIEKSLMSFDEITKLEDTSSASSGGGVGGGAIAPSIDLSKMATSVPEWVEKIPKLKEPIEAIVIAIASITHPIETIATAAALWYSNQKKLSKEVKTMNNEGLKANEKWIKQEQSIDDINKEINAKMFQRYDLLDTFRQPTTFLVGASKDIYSSMINTFRIQNQMVDEEIRLYRQKDLTNDQQLELTDILENNLNEMEELIGIGQFYNYDVTELVDLHDKWEDYLTEITGKQVSIRQATKDIKTGQELINEQTKEATNQTKNWWERSKDVFDKFKDINNLKLADKTLTVDIEANTNKFKETWNNMLSKFGNFPGINMAKFKLASGGIINQPGKGVQLGTSIIGGEAGPEAVLPLTDETFKKLGEAIASRMEVNLTNINQMNGRTIAREVKKVNNENDFLKNE